MDYTVTEYSEEHREQVLDLHARLMQSGRRLSSRYLRWKYEENPYIPSPLLSLIRHGKEIVGMRGLFGTCWSLGPGRERVVLPHADDLIIHPEHRNRGLFLLIHNATVKAARERGFPAILSLSGGETTQKLSLVTGYKALGDLGRIYRHPSRGSQTRRAANIRFPPLRAIRSRFRRFARRLGFSPGRRPTDESVDKVGRAMVSGTNGKIRLSREPDYAGMSSLAESIAPHHFQAVRNEEFLRWRLRNPDRKYRFLYWQDSSMRGFVILAWTRESPHLVRIADLAARDDSVFQELLEAVGDSGNTQFMLMSSTLPESQRSLARAAGFVPDSSFSLDQRRRFLFFPLSVSGNPTGLDLDPESYPAKWRVGLIDTMGS